jgi:hypothetical protein
MGRDFAMDAVQVLSRFPAWVDVRMNASQKQIMNPRLALAGLIVMVCESARMNPVHNYIARWWSYKLKEVTSDLIREYVLDYGRTSRKLLTWKRKGYADHYPISWMQDIYLLLNCRLGPPRRGYGPRVELLAMRADLGVVGGATVMVFDGKRGHIIYRKEEQGEQVYTTPSIMYNPIHTNLFASKQQY